MKTKAKGSESASDLVKTSLRLPRELWNRTRHQAIDEDRDIQEIVADALAQYLKTTKGGRA